MIKISAQITGIPDIQLKLKKITDKAEMEKTMEKAAILVEGEAKRMCPVATGRLQQSITHHPRGALTQEIIASTNYASFIEYGTMKLPVGSIESPLIYKSTSGKFPSYRPFLRPALYLNIHRIEKLFDEDMKEK
jgi:HK97 gp10 family phage protein